VGFDKTLTYARLERACLLLAGGCPYFATHPDFTCITDRGLIPDTGAILAAIESVVHRRPKVLGKPMPEMVSAGLARLGPDARPESTAIIGDQLDTDMTMAASAGLVGILVLSGETSIARLEAQDEVRPDLVVASVAELLPWLGEG
jgi:ribonucleotide monophosphatase NagD (HAD superfamily)